MLRTVEPRPLAAARHQTTADLAAQTTFWLDPGRSRDGASSYSEGRTKPATWQTAPILRPPPASPGQVVFNTYHYHHRPATHDPTSFLLGPSGGPARRNGCLTPLAEGGARARGSVLRGGFQRLRPSPTKGCTARCGCCATETTAAFQPGRLRGVPRPTRVRWRRWNRRPPVLLRLGFRQRASAKGTSPTSCLRTWPPTCSDATP
jgi:hypothetical protein